MTAPEPMLTASQRLILWVSFLVNVTGTLFFCPPLLAVRQRFGLPEAEPFYLWLVSSWILLFGLAYLSMALRGRLDRAILAIGAGAKTTFALLVIAYVLSGRFPAQATALALTDLALAFIYVRWLRQRAPDRMNRRANFLP
jgi:hypothetical protein